MKNKTAMLFTALALTFGATPMQAAEEKVLLVYNWSDYFAPDTLDNFEKETGIHVTYDTFDSNEVLETKLLTGSSGYDVVFPASSNAEREFLAGALAPIDRTRLSNFGNIDTAILDRLSSHQNADKLGVPYLWGTVGIGYNETMINARMVDAPIDSFDIFFKPELAAKFADCGIAILDSPQEVISIALNYLGLDPFSAGKDDLAKVNALLAGLRPHVRYINSVKALTDLANGDICLALAYNGDVGLAQLRADEAGNGLAILYAVPKEGTLIWFDLMSIPVDATHPENAYTFINYLMQPQVIADISNTMFYANPNTASLPMLDPDLKGDPGIYPPADTMARLFGDKTIPPKSTRLRTRLWTTFKSGL